MPRSYRARGEGETALWWHLCFTFAIVIVVSLAGCATKPDPIDRLAANLSASGGIWQNGFPTPALDLPQSASATQLVSRVFDVTVFDSKRVADYRIVKARKVHISASDPGDYIAVLAATNLGPKLILFAYEGPKTGWWHRTYDANPPYVRYF